MEAEFAFLFYAGDYLRDTQCLSEKAQVAYDRMMCEHMRNTCISEQQLAFFTKRLSEDEKNELMFVLSSVDGGYQITWIANSIQKRKDYSESRRKNRAKQPEAEVVEIPKEAPPKKEKKEPVAWKTDFEIYLNCCRDGCESTISDAKWILKQTEFNPKIDIAKSIEKSCTNFWATKEGWKNKKKSGSDEINWKLTFANAISQAQNKVWLDSGLGKFQSEGDKRRESSAKLGIMAEAVIQNAMVDLNKI